jgi:cobalt-zinc-cadmium efflux system protein
MAHGHSTHHHGHGHQHGPVSYGRAFAIGIALNLTFVAIEFIAGTMAHSLALVADAGHNLSDVLGLALAWGAAALSGLPSSARRTYGFRRSSILAALINACVLLLTLGGIVWESIQRLAQPDPVVGTTVITVALVGIGINAFTAWLFFSGRHDDLNVRGAFLHLAADAAVSLGVVLAGVVMLATGWYWIDPIVSLVIAGIIFLGTWGLLRESLNLALDGVPAQIDCASVYAYLRSRPEVLDAHDLHIWAMSTTETALTAHLVLADTSNTRPFLNELSVQLHDQFGVEHATLQIETGAAGQVCPLSTCVPMLRDTVVPR